MSHESECSKGIQSGNKKPEEITSIAAPDSQGKIYMSLEAANCIGTFFFFSPNPEVNLAGVSDLQFEGKARFW